jgi:hypothetical protein
MFIKDERAGKYDSSTAKEVEDTPVEAGDRRRPAAIAGEQAQSTEALGITEMYSTRAVNCIRQCL